MILVHTGSDDGESFLEKAERGQVYKVNWSVWKDREDSLTQPSDLGIVLHSFNVVGFWFVLFSFQIVLVALLTMDSFVS